MVNQSLAYQGFPICCNECHIFRRVVTAEHKSYTSHNQSKTVNKETEKGKKISN